LISGFEQKINKASDESAGQISAKKPIMNATMWADENDDTTKAAKGKIQKTKFSD